MTTATLETIISPLVRRQIFPTPVEAVRTLVQDYAYRQIARYEGEITQFEEKYSMNWKQFTAYTAERTNTLRRGTLSAEQRRVLSQAMMREEDDWLEWKAALELRQSWLELLAEEEELLR